MYHSFHVRLNIHFTWPIADKKVLDVYDNQIKSGQPVILWERNGQENQRFVMTERESGYYSIDLKDTGFVQFF